MPKLSITPLFEKLLDEDTEIPFEKVPKSFMSFEDLQKSIMEDVSRLLNTRISVFWKDYAQKNQMSPFSYGVDITAAISPNNVVEIRELEVHIENALKAFEPRLIEPKVYVQGVGNDPSSLFINIDAYIEMNNRRIPASFPVILNT